jgi:ABC-type proline/glycine betaine transport system substrate-binding protein
MKNNKNLFNFILEMFDCETTIKQNSKLLLYVSKNNNYDTISIDDWINISKKPLTDNDIERMKMVFWLLEHQKNIEKVLAD